MRRTVVGALAVGAVALTARRLTARPLVPLEPLDPVEVERFVESVSFSHEGDHAGVTLVLTSAGLDFGRQRDAGAWSLAEWVMTAPEWRGDRSLPNVAEEVWAHAVAWHLPLLRGRANPVNIEFYHAWPRSLLVIAFDRLRRKLRRTRSRT